MSRRQQRRQAMRRRTHMAVASGGAAAIASLATGAVAHAAITFTVTNLNDSGTGSLRAAIAAVNADTTDTAAPGDSIVFASGLSGTINLTTTANSTDALDLGRPAQITGPGANQLTVHGPAGYSVLGANRASGVTTMATTLSGFTVTGGSGQTGPGIDSYGSVELDSMAFTGNSGTYGAVDVFGPNSAVTIKNSTISGNTSTKGPGAVYSKYGGTITDSTISGNTGPAGAAIEDRQGSMAITDSTVANNTDSSTGGTGGQVYTYSGTVALQDSIVSGAGTTPDVAIGTKGSGSASFSLIRNATAPSGDTAITTDATDIVGKDPQLGALANNGGPTETMLPAATSPVLDQGKSFGLTTDQRGLSRPFALPIASIPAGGDRSDIGAVEVHALYVGGLSPNTGTQGTRVTITGGDFTGATGVLFGSTPASSFTVLNDTTIVATAPAQNGGSVDVRVITPGGESAAVPIDVFTFQTFTPTVSKPHAKLAGKQVKTGIKVNCPAGGFSCKGSFKATAYLGHHKAKLGGGNISLTAGHSKTITFKLSKKALKQLEKTGHLKITIQITIADGNGKTITANRTITIKPAHKKHHKHH